ncbi:uncharacterized protein LOC111055477 [Nilaparvata lugens]|uniref:uncharacterized protein LOC111055477 n=1 Tax=Nilaparvata lugens TaxID=108931 RepID=UPI00193EC118|nr:uncharacterized protein LOC111055477 [Nilaparvata lugens]
MNDEKLIQLVRVYPALYDISHPKYMDADYKKQIWKFIGNELEANGSLCRTRWNNIRDNFRKSLKKRSLTALQKGQCLKPYKYNEQLSFLNQFFQESENLSHISDEKIQDLETVEVGEGDEMEMSISNRSINDVFNEKVDNRQPPASSDIHSVPEILHLFEPRTRIRTSPSTASTVMDYLVKQRECSQNPVDAFLAGVAPVLKKLRPRDWHFAKEEIFAIVQKYELRTIDEECRGVASPETDSSSKYSNHIID